MPGGSFWSGSGEGGDLLLVKNGVGVEVARGKVESLVKKLEGKWWGNSAQRSAPTISAR